MVVSKKTVDQLLDFVADRNLRFLSRDVPSTKKKVQILARAVKLGEEVGELYNDVLGYLGLQRQDKLEKFTLENLEEEVVDVLITLLVLVSLFPEMDIETAIKRKIKKIKARDRR